ncbi:cytochrome P450 [Spirillospora sp. NPDC029432]|uniref:cytochrome P450 n=1 Tax=Spirillospora sp. NPDC029432 TaxID=3154599 RepID=UPI00345236D6
MTTSGIPTAPGALPLVGHAPRMLRDPLRFVAGLAAHGDLVRIRQGTSRAVVVCRPDLVREVLRDDSRFSPGDHPHGGRRGAAGPAFDASRMPGYAAVMAEHIERVTGRWKDGRIVDVAAEARDIAAAATFGALVSGGASRAAARRCVRDARTVLDGAYRRTFPPVPPARPPGPGRVRRAAANRRLRQAVKEFTDAYRAEGDDRGDLLSVLAGVHDGGADEPPRTPDEIADQALAFFGAGWCTTAATVAWALHLLAGRPDVQRRLHLEADAVLDGGTAAFEHLPRLEVTGRIVTETLRMYPPVWLLTRTLSADTELGGQRLRAGTALLCSPYLIHHREDLYPDPGRFDPDRWTADKERPSDAYLAFGAGDRGCAGDAFAVTAATLTLASIAARWRLLPVPGAAPRAKAAGTISPEGLRMRTMSRSAVPSLTREGTP